MVMAWGSGTPDIFNAQMENIFSKTSFQRHRWKFKDGWLDNISSLSHFNANKAQWVLSSFSHVQLCDTTHCGLWGSSPHRILQARILEWVVMGGLACPPKGSSQPRDWTAFLMSLTLVGGFFTTSTTWEAEAQWKNSKLKQIRTWWISFWEGDVKEEAKVEKHWGKKRISITKFCSNPKERQCQRTLKLLHSCIHLTRYQSNAQNSPSKASTVREQWTSRCSRWI